MDSTYAPVIFERHKGMKKTSIMFEITVKEDIKKLRSRIKKIKQSLASLGNQDSRYANEHKALIKCHESALSGYLEELAKWNEKYNQALDQTAG